MQGALAAVVLLKTAVAAPCLACRGSSRSPSTFRCWRFRRGGGLTTLFGLVPAVVSRALRPLSRSRTAPDRPPAYGAGGSAGRWSSPRSRWPAQSSSLRPCWWSVVRMMRAPTGIISNVVTTTIQRQSGVSGLEEGRAVLHRPARVGPAAARHRQCRRVDHAGAGPDGVSPTASKDGRRRGKEKP